MANAAEVTELISSLEQASLMAKQIGAAMEETQLLQVYSSLSHARHRLSVFLANADFSGNCVSSAEPMQLVEEADERNAAVEKVAERMRECFTKKNKRVKRPLSPSEEMGSPDDRFGSDPHAAKLRALDLVYQFHG
ncbi:PREDICTED: uncharacterized protein LOC104814091 [Tarenaya hassleriana]|uniref:uncharacterized protein LOC104814091 n=1 Tax=Tarenaya hassleriana TaxID=28532 RepID=UPI00053C0A36|nr:PREDICTED: uncharacterized protein LOC104814091 [Tarenaya hassleriana]